MTFEAFKTALASVLLAIAGAYLFTVAFAAWVALAVITLFAPSGEIKMCPVGQYPTGINSNGAIRACMSPGGTQ